MRDRLEDAGVALAAALASRLSPPVAARVGRALGRTAHALGVRRAVARANMARALTERTPAEVDTLVRRSYEHVGRSVLEFMSLPGLDRAACAARVDLEGLDHVQAALTAGRGAVVAAGHLGNWEFGGAGAAAHGLPVTFVVQPLRNARVDARLEALRRGAGINTISRGMALRRVRAALAADRLVFIMCDQDARRHGTFVPFFGIPASTPRGAAQMSLRFHVPMLTAFVERRDAMRHCVRFGAPLAAPENVPEETAVIALLAAFNARLEAAVRRAPEQYWWAHRRWKTHPPAPSDAATRIDSDATRARTH